MSGRVRPGRPATRAKGRNVTPTLTRKQAQEAELFLKQDEARDWIQRVLNEEIPGAPGDDIHEVLKDGIILCRVMNKLFPKAIPKINPASSLAFKHRENIGFFIDFAIQLGVPEAARPQVDDLYEKQNMRSVLNTLEMIAVLVAKNGHPIKWGNEDTTTQRAFDEETLELAPEYVDKLVTDPEKEEREERLRREQEEAERKKKEEEEERKRKEEEERKREEEARRAEAEARIQQELAEAANAAEAKQIMEAEERRKKEEEERRIKEEEERRIREEKEAEERRLKEEEEERHRRAAEAAEILKQQQAAEAERKRKKEEEERKKQEEEEKKRKQEEEEEKKKKATAEEKKKKKEEEEKKRKKEEEKKKKEEAKAGEAEYLVIKKELESENPNKEGVLHVAAQSDETAEVLIYGTSRSDASEKLVEKDINGNTPLHTAVEFTVTRNVQLLLEAGSDPNAQNNDGDTPLHMASVRSCPEIMHLIIDNKKKKTDIDETNGAGNTALHCAVAEDDEEAAEILIAAGAKTDKKNKKGETPMHLACKEGNAKLTKLLIAKGASATETNANGETPLHLACTSGNTDTVSAAVTKESVNQQRNDGSTPLHIAVQRGNVAAVKILLENGADVNLKNNAGETALILATQKDNSNIITLLTQHGAELDAQRDDGWTALYTGAYQGNDKTVKLLCEQGADVNQPNGEGWTPLHAAAAAGNNTIVEILVNQYKANVNAQSNQGTTPLYHAAAENHPSTCKLLLDAGTDVNLGAPGKWRPIHIAVYTDLPEVLALLCKVKGIDLNARNSEIKGYTALHVAVASKTCSLDVIKLLIKTGATLEEKNDNGQTPLHLAVFWNKPEVVKLLVDKGANLNATNKKGRNPLDLACHFGYSEVAQILAKKMGVKCPQMKKHDRVTVSVDTPVAPPNPDELK